MEYQNDTAENTNESGNIVPETISSKKKTWIYRIACVLLFASGIAFFIFFIIVSQHVPWLNNTGLVILSEIAALLIVCACFKTGINVTASKVAALIIAGIVLAAGWYVYFRYLPKYSLNDARAIVQSDPKYASSSIELVYYPYPDLCYGNNKDNPFCEWGYTLDVISDGKVTAHINFDSATGKYESYEPQD